MTARFPALACLILTLATGCSGKSVESSAEYQAACAGPPMGNVEKRNEAMENGYEINRKFDCIDRASFARVNRQSAAWNAANPGAAAAAKRDAEARRVEDAVIGVLGIEDLVSRMENTCAPVATSSVARYHEAAAQWRARNGRTVAGARRALSTVFEPARQMRIRSAIDASNRQMFASVLGSSSADRLKWCEGSAGEIDDGRLDVHNKLRLAGPLENYSAR